MQGYKLGKFLPLVMIFLVFHYVIYATFESAYQISPPWRSLIYPTIKVTTKAIVHFNTTGIESFIKTFRKALMKQENQLVLMCDTSHHVCGGIADRSRGIPYALSLAILTERQFIIHPSLLTNEPIPDIDTQRNSHYIFVDDYCNEPILLAKLLLDRSQQVFVTSNCEVAMPSEDILPSNTSINPSLALIKRDCDILQRCGAAVIHDTEMFRHELERAQLLVSNLPMLPLRDYTALHIRAGGSVLNIDNHTVAAVPWHDGHEDGVAQAWLNLFRDKPFRNCKKGVAVVSDSQRLLSEMRLLAADGLLLSHCCSQPLHRDRYITRRFPFQEIVDLYVLARSSHIIATNGGFGVLGQYWLGGSGPRLSIARWGEEIKSATKDLVIEASCEN